MQPTIDRFMNDSFPLMEIFKEKAPGSQKHCSAVCNLCLSVAKQLNIDDHESLLCAALYHDVGKIFNPNYFIENQTGENPHGSIADPYMSYQIISRHVSDSVLILHQYKFPTDVIDIVSEHHGNSSIKIFLAKCKLDGLDKKDIEDLTNKYRYKCNKPQSTESSILMICDVVEAAMRSKHSAGQLDNVEVIIKTVDSLINNLIEDDQLDNLKIGAMKKIKNLLVTEMESSYHSRILYPEQTVEPSK